MGVATLTEGVPNERLDLAQPGVGEYEHQDHGQHVQYLARRRLGALRDGAIEKGDDLPPGRSDRVVGRPASGGRGLAILGPGQWTDYFVAVLTPPPPLETVLSAIAQAAASPEVGSLLPGIVANPAFSMMSRCVYDEVSSLSRASCLAASGCFM
jgi:hypothetical protein